MKRHESLIPLSQDHKSTLFLAGQLKFNAPDYPGYPKDIHGKTALLAGEFEFHIKEHFRKEEEILFKSVRNKSPELRKLTNELVLEHHKITQLIQQALLKSAAELLHEIGEMLQQHIRKEERQLFELIQQTLSENELLDLGKKLKTD
ncbi:MAG: hemerythrin domain-containing protein [Bacteroidia bacterium]